MKRLFNPATNSLETPRDPVYDQLLAELHEQFSPTTEETPATFKRTTEDIYQQFQDIYPADTYSRLDVYADLIKLGFSWYLEPRSMVFHWFFKLK